MIWASPSQLPENPKFWDFPINYNGKEYSFNNSISLFTDKFGKSGPKNWIYGDFNEGEENFPVKGISWFEARAYAKYKGLSLPNIFQWLDAANLSGFKSILPNLDGSNFNSNKPRNVHANSKRYKELNIIVNGQNMVVNGKQMIKLLIF